MKTVTMTTDSPATAREGNKINKFFTQTTSTKGLVDVPNKIYGVNTFGVFAVILMFTGVAYIYQNNPNIVAQIVGWSSFLAGLGGIPICVFTRMNLKKLLRNVTPKATAEVSSWLEKSYGLQISDATTLKLATFMSTIEFDDVHYKNLSTAWQKDFENEAGEAYRIRVNSKRLFYIEKSNGQAAQLKAPESPARAIASITAQHPSTSAITKADAQLLESIQTKASSLLTDDTSTETKTIVEQVTAEAMKAVELNQKLAKFSSKTLNSKLSSTLRILNSELDEVLEKEAAAVQREMEEQNLYVRSRPQAKIGSKLVL